LEALIRTGQPYGRKANFAACGASCSIARSREVPPRFKLIGSACHDRVCIPCANTRARVIALNAATKLRNTRCRFVTLTLRAGKKPLKVSVSELHLAFSRIRKTATWKRYVSGGCAFLEVKRSSRSDNWHPHLHVLIEGSYYPHEQLKGGWHQATRDSDVVDIRSVKSNEQVSRYVTKYASKPISASITREPAHLDEAIVALKGVKLCITFGTWRGEKLTRNPDDAAWDIIADFHQTVLAAAAGDRSAIGLLSYFDGAGVQAAIAAAPRGPPPAQPREKCTTYEQLLFTDSRAPFLSEW
jgi:hypothetical protein